MVMIVDNAGQSDYQQQRAGDHTHQLEIPEREDMYFAPVSHRSHRISRPNRGLRTKWLVNYITWARASTARFGHYGDLSACAGCDEFLETFRVKLFDALGILPEEEAEAAGIKQPKKKKEDRATKTRRAKKLRAKY